MVTMSVNDNNSVVGTIVNGDFLSNDDITLEIEANGCAIIDNDDLSLTIAVKVTNSCLPPNAIIIFFS